MKPIETITKILNEQVKSYKLLLNLLQKERASLIDFNAEGVEELSKEKDTLVLKLRLLEEERIRLMKKFFDDEISLQKLSEITGNKTFSDIRLKLISLVQGIEELNEFNRLLIERSLNYIKTTTHFFGSFGFGYNKAEKGTLLLRET